MTLGQFIEATKHLPPNTRLFVARVGTAGNDGYEVERVTITVTESSARDITLRYGV